MESHRVYWRQRRRSLPAVNIDVAIKPIHDDLDDGPNWNQMCTK